MTELNILLVSEDIPHPKMGGLGKHVITLGNALIASGHRVDLFGNNYYPYEQMEGDVIFQGNFYPELNVKNGQWKEKQLGFFNYYRRAFLAYRFARAILAVRNRYDVIHYHGHLPILSNFIPKHVNFVQTRHDQGSDCLTHTRFNNGAVCYEINPAVCSSCATQNPNTLQRALSKANVIKWRTAVKQAFQRHKVIFVSHFLQHNLVRTLGSVEEGNVDVVYNFTDTRQIAMALEETSSNHAEPDIFIAARVDLAKGVGAFLEAMKENLPEGRNVTVAGDGPDLESLRQHFNGGWVKFLGWTSYKEVIRLTVRAKIVVVPSVCEESCATSILEALALGQRVLALKRGGTPELVMYQRYPGQLQLHNTLESMVHALKVIHANEFRLAFDNNFKGGVEHMLPKILNIYRKNRVG